MFFKALGRFSILQSRSHFIKNIVVQSGQKLNNEVQLQRILTQNQQQSQNYFTSLINFQKKRSDEELKIFKTERESEKMAILEKILEIPRDQIPSIYGNYNLLNLAQSQFENRLNYYLNVAQIPKQNLILNLQIVAYPSSFFENKVEELQNMGFSDAKNLLQRRPDILGCEIKVVQSNIEILSELLNVEKIKIVEQFEKYPGGIFSTVERSQAIIQELKNMGFSNEEIFTILEKNTSFLRNPVDRLQAMTKFFEEQELNLKKILLQQPGLIRTSIHRFKGMVLALKNNLGYDNEFIEEIMIKYPVLMSWQSEVLENKIQFFKQYGITDETIKDIFKYNTRILTTGVEKMKKNIDFLQNDLGCNSDEMTQIFLKNSQLLRQKVQTLVAFFESKNFTKEEVKKIFFKLPKVGAISLSTLQNNWNFLLNEGKFQDEKELHDFLVEFPSVLQKDISGPTQFLKIKFIEQNLNLTLKQALQKNSQIFNFSLQDRLGPRSWIISEKNPKGIKKSDIDRYLGASDEKFVEIMGGEVASSEEYKFLVEQWKSEEWIIFQQQFQS